MNADMNPRGGLTVDRDSLHASPGYARQVAAAKQLQERSVNADLQKAVERAVRYTDFGRPLLATDLHTIRQHLRDQEAEIAGLRADLSDADERAAMRNRERTEAVMRAEKADALLRECLQHHGVMLTSDPPQDAWKYHRMNDRITAHLGGEQ